MSRSAPGAGRDIAFTPVESPLKPRAARTLLWAAPPMIERETLFYVMPFERFWLVRRIGGRPELFPNRDDAVAAALTRAASHGRARVKVIAQVHASAV